MKKTENLKSVILLLVATGIAIGLLSSTAVKLASATTLLKQTNSLGSVQIADDEETTEDTTEETSEAATDKPADKPADNPSTDGTTAPSDGSGNGDGSNGGDSGDSGSDGSGSGDSGSSDSGILDTIMGLLGGLGDIELPDLGGLIGGEDTPEEEPEETPVDNTTEYKSIMSSYKAIVERAKVSDKEFTKTTDRTIDWNILYNLFIGKAGDITVDDVKYFDNTVTVSGIANKDPSFILNNKFACLINTLDDGAVDEAVKSAQKTTLEDGNTKIVIEFNDSTPDGFISSVLPTLTDDQVKALFNSGISAGLTDVTVTYTGCSVELVYNAATGDIVSLIQVINYNVDASGTKTFSTTITETNTYTF